jgi:hypothetical protein
LKAGPGTLVGLVGQG